MSEFIYLPLNSDPHSLIECTQEDYDQLMALLPDERGWEQLPFETQKQLIQSIDPSF